jgi:hypothetical protein
VRDSPFTARSEIEELELLVMVPLKVEPSFSVTVALWPDPGPESLAQLPMDVATVITIAITNTFKIFTPGNEDTARQSRITDRLLTTDFVLWYKGPAVRCCLLQ